MPLLSSESQSPIDWRVPRNAQQKNRQKEQVTRHMAPLFHITCCNAIRPTSTPVLRSRQSPKKGRLLIALKTPSNEDQGKPPEKASYPCHGRAAWSYWLESAYERTTRKPLARASYPSRGCAILHYLRKRWDRLSLLYSDPSNRQKRQITCCFKDAYEQHQGKPPEKASYPCHACASFKKGQLLVALKMPTNEHQGKPPEKASYPCHGCAFWRIN